MTLFFVACPMIVSGCVEFLTSYAKKAELEEPISKYDVTVHYPIDKDYLYTQKVVRVNFNIYCTFI